jgi:DNA-binding HxlR family transcriptional regulator
MKEQVSPYEIKESCPVIYALSIIGQKWKIPILWHLADENKPIRYNELKRSIPTITNIMLTKSLQELEEHGIIDRKQYDCIPPKVEYSLTKRGESLIPILHSIHEWGQEQINIDYELLVKKS